jgi:hypothetical protein
MMRWRILEYRQVQIRDLKQMTDDRPPFTHENDGNDDDQDRSLADTRATDSASTRRLDSRDRPAAPRQRQQPQSRARQRRSQPSPQNRSSGNAQQYPTQRPARRGTARARRNSSLYLPLWSLALMLFLVMAAAAGIVFIVLSLGGNAVPEAVPIVIVSSPIPTTRPDSFPISPATATIPPEANIILTRPPVTFSLSGPTLAPPPVTPTPQRIALGEQIIVVDVGITQLNVRDSPGVIDTTILFRTEEGTIFTVVDGPQQADGLTWWKIQDPANPVRAGWAASNYLEVISGQ